jgi:hypothetical protein
MDDVLQLPRQAPEVQSSSHGALRRYQETLINQYQVIIGRFEQSAAAVTTDCSIALSKRMDSYLAESFRIKESQDRLIGSMGSSSVAFAELQGELTSLADSSLQLITHLREDILATYSASFDTIRPMVDAAASATQIIISQIPPQFAERLPFAVKKLNQNYLRTKQLLVRTLYERELEVHQHNEEVRAEFWRRTSEWKTNRFGLIFDESRRLLDPSYPIDFGTLYDEFREYQRKFTHVARKLLVDLLLITPPDHFADADLALWWRGVEEFLEGHVRFITEFTGRFQAKIDERNKFNSDLLASAERELSELKSEGSELDQAMNELTPLFKQSQRRTSLMMERLQKYWSGRTESLKKSFDTIRDFLRPLIRDYGAFVAETEKNARVVDSEIKEIKATSTQAVNELESNLASKANEILLLVSEKEISARVADCKQILSKIEAEFRTKYDKIIAIYAGQPSLVFNLFEACEAAVLAVLKLKKTANAIEMNPDRPESSASKKKPVRGQRRSAKPKPEFGQINRSSVFSFSVESGAKFEEAEPLVLIPVFDDFLDDVPATPTKAKHAKQKPPPTRAKRAGKAAARGAKPARVDEIEDVDVPEFSLLDVVPKHDGVVAIWVYIPTNEDIADWANTFRQVVMSNLYATFSSEMRRASYRLEKEELTNELGERMRVHAPRASEIELNIAQTRILQIESKKNQLEKHLRHAVTNFNKGLAGIESSMENRKQSLIAECQKLRTYIDDLANQKASTASSMLNQNFQIAHRNFQAIFDQKSAEQTREIETFLVNFKAVNERFIQTVVMAGQSYSQEERELSNQFFAKMDSQIETIVGRTREKQTANEQEIDQLRRSIIDEFETSAPHHASDIKFIEALGQLQTDIRSRYQALLSRNKQQELEIDAELTRGFQPIEAPASAGFTKLKTLFERIDNTRLLLTRRGKFLGILKSSVNVQPIVFNLNLLEDPTVAKKGDETESVAAAKRGGKAVKGKAKGKSLPASEKTKPKAQVAADPPPAPLPTLKGQTMQLTNELTANVNQLANEYYTNLKNRKFRITRPSQIPSQPNECADAIAKSWQSQITDVSSVIDEAILRYRTQVQIAATLVRAAQATVFKVFSDFYVDLVGSHRADVQIIFDAEMRQSGRRRTQHSGQLNAQLADSNRVNDFEQLCADEQERTEAELTLIAEFEAAVLDAEYRDMRLYAMRLPAMTALLLESFDAFPATEDLIPGATVGIERRTMKEMMKDRERRNAGANDPAGRPFHTREWPPLPLVMDPFVGYATPTDTAEVPQPLPKGKKAPKEAAQAKADEGRDLGDANQSLDTALCRGTIIERTRNYEEYQVALAKRLNDFRVYVESLRAETDAFTTYWHRCLASLRPRQQFAEPVEVIEDK